MREQVRVITRQADQREHLSCARIDDDRSAGRLPIADETCRQRLRGCTLKRRVKAEIHRVAGHGRLRRDRPDNLSACVDLDVGPAIPAAEQGLDARLHADFAHDLARPVAELPQAFQVGVVERPDIADHVSEDERIDVGPHRSLHDRSAGHLGQPFVDRELLLWRQVRIESDGRVQVRRRESRRHLRLRLTGDARQLRQLDRARAGVERQTGGHHLQAPHRAVRDKGRPMAVVDDSAVGLQDNSMPGVGAGHAGEGRAIADLELRKLDRQPAYGQHPQRGRGHQPHRPLRLGGHASQLDQTGSARLVTGECSLRTVARTRGIRAAL